MRFTFWYSESRGELRYFRKGNLYVPRTARINDLQFLFQVVEALLPNSLVNREVQELQHILTKPHFKVKKQNRFTTKLYV